MRVRGSSVDVSSVAAFVGGEARLRTARQRVRSWIRDTGMVARRMTAELRLRPDFVIIGAQRSGTTSLYHSLAGHPCVGPAERKEVHFFDLNYEKGDLWYRAHFPLRASRRLHRLLVDGTHATGEACPYYLFHPGVPERLFATLPGVRLIVMLRNPADRAISHYHHERRKGRERLSLAEALAQEEQRIDAEIGTGAFGDAHRNFSYVSRGRYAEQLERWWRWFPREQMLVLSSEDFFRRPDAEYRRVTDFLGLPRRDPPENLWRNRGGYKEEDALVRSRLLEYYRPHNERLYELLGTSFGW